MFVVLLITWFHIECNTNTAAAQNDSERMNRETSWQIRGTEAYVNRSDITIEEFRSTFPITRPGTGQIYCKYLDQWMQMSTARRRTTWLEQPARGHPPPLRQLILLWTSSVPLILPLPRSEEVTWLCRTAQGSAREAARQVSQTDRLVKEALIAEDSKSYKWRGNIKWDSYCASSPGSADGIRSSANRRNSTTGILTPRYGSPSAHIPSNREDAKSAK